MPCPRSWRGAAPSEGAQAVRWPVLRVHLALRRWSQRPSIDRRALDCRQLSCRHVTRVSPSNSFSVCSLFSALSAGVCPLVLSGSGKPLTHGSPLHPSHLRWGCCMNYCGAPDAGGSQVQCFVGLPCINLQTTLHLDKLKCLNTLVQVFFHAHYCNSCVLAMRNQMPVCHDGIDRIFTPVFVEKFL